MTDNRDNNNDGNICHILPCSIEEDITAPIAQYFHPTQLPAEALPLQNNTNNEGSSDIAKKDDNAVTIMAAQFRGRGLLCAVDSTNSSTTTENGVVDDAAAQEDDNKSSQSTTNTIPLSKLPPTLIGVALSQSSSSSSNTTTTTTTTANSNNNSKDPPIQSLKVVETFNKIYNWSHEHDVQKVIRERHGTDKYGLNAVLQWCDLAHEVSIWHTNWICIFILYQMSCV